MRAILYSTVSPHNHYSNDHKKFQEVSLSCRFTICGIVVLHIVEARIILNMYPNGLATQV